MSAASLPGVPPQDRLLSTGEAARLLNFRPQRVIAWCDSGKMWHMRTLGGHRRVRYGDIMEILEKRDQQRGADA